MFIDSRQKRTTIGFFSTNSNVSLIENFSEGISGINQSGGHPLMLDHEFNQRIHHLRKLHYPLKNPKILKPAL